MACLSCSIAVLPPILGISSLLAALLICYGIAVSQGHIVADFPYISHAGSELPESCLFSILFNIGAASGYVMFLTRYKLLQIYFGSDNISLNRANKVSLVLGLVSCTGIFIVGNFQSSAANYAVHMIHWVSAGSAMGIGVMYIWIHACLSVETMEERRGVRLLDSREVWVIIVRFCLAIIAIVAVVLFIVFLAIAEGKFTGTNQLLWSKDDGGYHEHIVSTGSEWALFFCVMFSFMSYAIEFRHIRLLSSPFTFAIDRVRTAPTTATTTTATA